MVFASLQMYLSGKVTSDSAFEYDFAKNIWSGGSYFDWSLSPAPSFFPDLFLALLLSPLGMSIVQFNFVISITQLILLFLVLLRLFSKLNSNIHDIYNIDLDLSDNVYRRNDAKTDISHNFYDTSGNSLLNNILSQLQGLTTKIDKCDVKTEDIKCIADFGTNIGDELCCGQSGILTDTKYVCPSNYSKCENMKCGSKYGVCVKP